MWEEQQAEEGRDTLRIPKRWKRFSVPDLAVSLISIRIYRIHPSGSRSRITRPMRSSLFWISGEKINKNCSNNWSWYRWGELTCRWMNAKKDGISFFARHSKNFCLVLMVDGNKWSKGGKTKDLPPFKFRKQQKTKKRGSTRIWTGVLRIKTSCANHYTIKP